MAKICKSCGNYYSGDYCDKCGYGKKAAPSKAAKKYKKATKPERFRTAEDNAVYAKWEKEKKAERQRKKDPNANRNFLIAVAIVVVGVILGVLIKSGAIFSNTRTEVVENYFKAIQTQDYDMFVKCLPKQIKQSYEDERNSLGMSKSEAMQAMYGELKDTYGDDYTIEIEFGKQTQLDADDFDMTEFKEAYGSAPTLTEVYEMVVNVTFSGSKQTEEAVLYLEVAKVSGYWRIFGLTEDVGIITEENVTAQ